MSIATRQQRMSAVHLAGVWRGPMVRASEAGFNAGNRAAAAFMYSGLLFPPVTAFTAIVDATPYSSIASADPYIVQAVADAYSGEATADPYLVSVSVEPS